MVGCTGVLVRCGPRELAWYGCCAIEVPAAAKVTDKLTGTGNCMAVPVFGLVTCIIWPATTPAGSVTCTAVIAGTAVAVTDCCGADCWYASWSTDFPAAATWVC